MLFFVMVTLTEQKWIILRERQGDSGLTSKRLIWE